MRFISLVNLSAPLSSLIGKRTFISFVILKVHPFWVFFPTHTSLSLEAFVNADWASCPDSRCSVTGYCVYLGSTLISWKSKKQAIVSRSSTEAEYHNLATTVCELQWCAGLLLDFSVSSTVPISLWCDNQVALHITKNHVFYEHTKHLEIICHLVRDQYKVGFVLPRHISFAAQSTDILTKFLFQPDFRSIVSKLGLVATHHPYSA